MRALIADRHPILQDGLELWLCRLDPDIEIAKSPGLAHALSVPGEAPDLMVCEIIDAEGSFEEGLSALRTLHNRHPNTAIIVFTTERNSHCVSRALEAGARGYIPKTYDGVSILNGIRLVLSGSVYVPQDLFQPATTETSGALPSSGRRAGTPKLTPRQRDVLVLLSRGFSNREIAHALGIAEGTIKIHVAAIFKAFGVSNRTQAVIEASSYGLLTRDGGNPAPMPVRGDGNNQS